MIINSLRVHSYTAIHYNLKWGFEEILWFFLFDVRKGKAKNGSKCCSLLEWSWWITTEPSRILRWTYNLWSVSCGTRNKRRSFQCPYERCRFHHACGQTCRKRSRPDTSCYPWTPGGVRVFEQLMEVALSLMQVSLRRRFGGFWIYTWESVNISIDTFQAQQ